MKKITSVIMALILISSLLITAAAENNNDNITYSTQIEFPEVVYYNEKGSHSENQIYVTVSVHDIALIKNGSVTLIFNPEVLEFDTAVFNEDTLFSKSFTETENSVTFKTAFNDFYNADRTAEVFQGISSSTTLIFNIRGTGNLDIGFAASVVTLNDKVVEAKVDINKFHPVAVDISEVELLDINGAFNNTGTSRFILNRTMTVAEMRRYYSAKITVLDKAGNIIGENDPIPTNASIVSTYNGYTVSKQLVTVLGDVNCDGKVNATDARTVLRISAKLEKTDGWIEAEAADCNSDNAITAADAREILRVAARTATIAPATVELKIGEDYQIGPLKNAGSGSYNWKCTLSDETAFTINDSVTPPRYGELNPGTPFEQSFTLKALKAGTYTAHFELSCPWNNDTADSFDIIFVVK